MPLVHEAPQAWESVTQFVIVLNLNSHMRQSVVTPPIYNAGSWQGPGYSITFRYTFFVPRTEPQRRHLQSRRQPLRGRRTQRYRVVIYDAVPLSENR
jgi:hypothetical protein